MLSQPEIEQSTLDEFIIQYEEVKSLVEDASKLQELVDAVNERVRTLPPVLKMEELNISSKSKRNRATTDKEKYVAVWEGIKSLSEDKRKEFRVKDLKSGIVKSIGFELNPSQRNLVFKIMKEKGIFKPKKVSSNKRPVTYTCELNEKGIEKYDKEIDKMGDDFKLYE